jgi:hypothetical protein
LPGQLRKNRINPIRGVVLTALRETESALTTYSRDLQRDDDFSTAQARAKEAEQQAQRLDVGGKIDFLPFLAAQRSLTAADGAVAASNSIQRRIYQTRPIGYLRLPGVLPSRRYITNLA